MNLSLLIFICVMYVECVTFLFKPQALSAKLGITISSISSFVVLKDEICKAFHPGLTHSSFSVDQ